VRTKFSNFKNEAECQKDKEDLCNNNEEIADIIKSCKDVIHVKLIRMQEKSQEKYY